MAREAEPMSRSHAHSLRPRGSQQVPMGCVAKEDDTRGGGGSLWWSISEAIEELLLWCNSCDPSVSGARWLWGDTSLSSMAPFFHEMSFSFIVKTTISIKPHLHFLTLLKATFFSFKNNSTAENIVYVKRGKSFLYTPSNFYFPLVRVRNENISFSAQEWKLFKIKACKAKSCLNFLTS